MRLMWSDGATDGDDDNDDDCLRDDDDITVQWL